MKKFSAVLLVLALVGGALFASFTGNAAVSFGVDFDKKEYGFVNSTELKAEITILERIGSAKGETDIYAEINAELALAFVLDDVSGVDLNATGLEGTAKITSAKIIGDNWYVGILEALGAPDMASSVIDVDSDGDTYLDLTFAGVAGAGVEVGVADFKFGLGIPKAANNWGNEVYHFFVSALTPNFEFADGLTGQFGAAGIFSKTTGGALNGGFASLKVGYATEEFDVTLASDMQFVKVDDNDLDFGVEVAVAAAYDFLTVDVYYATDEFAAQEDENDDPVLPYGGAKNVLSAQVGADVAGFDITVGGKDLVNTQDLYAKVGYAINEQISAAVYGGYVIATETWSAGAEATYKADMFTATASGDLKGTDALSEVKVKVGVSSTTLVDGATLALDYASGNFLDQEMGSVTAKATIGF
jgi:hypothetical protein